MLMYYIIIFGIIVFIVGLLELIIPEKMMSLWVKWTSSKYYFIHGIILIAAGFPLTQLPSNSLFSTPLFIVGLIIVFSGPFILLYPEKIKKIFFEGLNELGQKGNRFAVIIDGIARIIIGAMCIAAFYYSR